MAERIIITGGAGFIGSSVIRTALTEHKDIEILNLDKLTYAGNLESLKSIDTDPRYQFVKADICDIEALKSIIHEYKPTGIMHLAAESHVDRSIDGPSKFIMTNVVGTFNLLEVSKQYYSTLDTRGQENFRFHHISTDEVFGSLGKEGFFTETTAYDPRSPYSSSKASSDHLVRAWQHTYNLPTIVTNCSNNYGPYQFPEKLIPLITLNALKGEKLPVYGDGSNIRDWLFVDDHARALLKVFFDGQVGETYNIGGHNEKTNLEVVHTICDILDDLSPLESQKSRRDLITFVKDRPGHDQRYAIDASHIENTLGWKPVETFETGIKKTIEWYLNEQHNWCQRVTDGSYQRERLGTL